MTNRAERPETRCLVLCNQKILPIAIAILLLFPLAVSAEFVGLDANGDQQCGPEDMVYHAGPADVGTTRTIDVFLDDLPHLFGVGCTFCLTDRSRIGAWTWTHAMPEGWELLPAYDSDDPLFNVPLSAYIPERYPNYLCWLIQDVNFTFEAPITIYPFTIGTLEYQIADAGCVQWLFDSSPECTAVLSTTFETIYFDDPGEACDTVSCPGVTSAESESWGSVKRLFR